LKIDTPAAPLAREWITGHGVDAAGSEDTLVLRLQLAGDGYGVISLERRN
jgi:hypothetical protein